MYLSTDRNMLLASTVSNAAGLSAQASAGRFFHHRFAFGGSRIFEMPKHRRYFGSELTAMKTTNSRAFRNHDISKTMEFE